MSVSIVEIEKHLHVSSEKSVCCSAGKNLCLHDYRRMLIVNIDAGPTRHSLVSMYISLLCILMQKTTLLVLFLLTSSP